jgi:putative transposase
MCETWWWISSGTGREKTEIDAGRFIDWLGVRASKFYDWRERYGRVNEHNGWVPRDFWLAPWEKQAIIGFHREHPLEGYRRLTFMMLDADVVAVSPSSVWRVLQQAGLLSRWKGKPSRKGSGFEQPPHAHQHWHIDVSYINVSGTFYYLCSVLDGYSRAIVHWDLRESMTEAEIEVLLQRAREKYPEAKPRIMSGNSFCTPARNRASAIDLPTLQTHSGSQVWPVPDINITWQRPHGKRRPLLYGVVPCSHPGS